MREGQRDGEDDSPETDDEQTADAGQDDEPAETQPAADTAPSEEPAAADDAAAATSTDGGAAATATEPEADEAENDDEAERDEPEQDAESAAGEADAEPTDTAESIDETVENVSGTRAELPSTEQMEAAMEQTMEQAEQVATPDESDAESEDDTEAEAESEDAAGPAGLAGETEETREPDTRVLEFTLDDEQYCLDIQYIEEIVKHTNITRVPNTPEFVEGVVDLRGQITTILNPKVTIDKPNKEAGDLIVVFDAEAFEDQGHIGWVVDDVHQVSPISDDQVNTPPMQEDYINGVIDRDDGEFVIWTTPDLALEEAE
jgi:purine-binding chemotaxis protein CheW